MRKKGVNEIMSGEKPLEGKRKNERAPRLDRGMKERGRTRLYFFSFFAFLLLEITRGGFVVSGQ